ncbi:MAG: hypothetical protein ACLQUW_04725 [Desulfobaccales bacterium]
MQFDCPRVLADFPAAKLRLQNREPARLIWDEHAGACVLRVEGLEVLEAPEFQGEASIWLEALLPPPASLADLIEGFAARHELRLEPAPAAAELLETPILAACHLPGQNLFIFCEASRLSAQRRGPERLELRVSGAFQTRRLLSRETDLIIHLTMASSSRLLTSLLAWSREGA